MSDYNQTLPASTLDAIIEVYAIKLEEEEENFNKKEFMEMVKKQRLEIHNNDDLLDLLGSLYPSQPHPQDYYEECAKSPNGVFLSASKAAKLANKEMASSIRKAEEELLNKLKCAQAEVESRKKQAQSSPWTTPQSSPKKFLRKPINVGDFVKIKGDFSPQKNSPGGSGWVIATSTEQDETFSQLTVTSITVEYVGTVGGVRNKKESGIGLERVIIQQHPESKRAKRRRSPSSDISFSTWSTETNTPQIPLKYALEDASRRNRSNGWRKRDICGKNMCKKDRDNLMLLDLREFTGILSGISQHHSTLQKRNKKGKFSKEKQNPLTWSFFAKAWGVSEDTITNWRRKNGKPERPQQQSSDPTSSVIDSMKMAEIKFSPRQLFIDYYIDTTVHDKNEQTKYVAREEAKAVWITMPENEKQRFVMESASKLDIQPSIRDMIIGILRKDPSKSFDSVAADINNWCSASTIARWFKKYEQESYYVERILPLLTTEQRKKQVQFCKELLSYWGFGPKKYLWIHYDEKWFWGLVTRANAKKCEVLGLEKQNYFAYHQNHINKVMMVAFVAYAFDGKFENGGHGIKLGLFRCQGGKIARRQVREMTRQADGQRRFQGPIVRRRGDVYMVDTCVTGSDEGTSDNPKFALKALFKDIILPRIADLVREKYPGYIPIIQGDNAGPHQDKEFLNFVKGECEQRGWHWKPQAPQMPHINNLDLTVFPAMSKKHTHLLRQYSKKVASNDTIWETAQAVWNSLDSASIARGFVLATRIAKKVIDNHGSNVFLRKGGLHCDVRSDFKNTDEGIVPKS